MKTFDFSSSKNWPTLITCPSCPHIACQDEFSVKDAREINDELGLLKKKLEIAVEALEFYGHKEIWLSTTYEGTFDGVPCSDFDVYKQLDRGITQFGGKKARNALKKIKELG